MKSNISLSRPIAATRARVGSERAAINEEKWLKSIYIKRDAKRRVKRPRYITLDERQLPHRPEGLLSIHMGGHVCSRVVAILQSKMPT
jgi:hypothetical protein